MHMIFNTDYTYTYCRIYIKWLYYTLVVNPLQDVAINCCQLEIFLANRTLSNIFLYTAHVQIVAKIHNFLPFKVKLLSSIIWNNKRC